jgi:hypothetical protein
MPPDAGAIRATPRGESNRPPRVDRSACSRAADVCTGAGRLTAPVFSLVAFFRQPSQGIGVPWHAICSRFHPCGFASAMEARESRRRRPVDRPMQFLGQRPIGSVRMALVGAAGEGVFVAGRRRASGTEAAGRELGGDRKAAGRLQGSNPKARGARLGGDAAQVTTGCRGPAETAGVSSPDRAWHAVRVGKRTWGSGRSEPARPPARRRSHQ